MYKLNAENILQGLKQNTTIRVLTLINALYGDLIFSRFFEVLHSNHTLEHLRLNLGESREKQNLDQAIQMDRLSRPIKLDLDKSWILKNVQEMEQLLRSHPEIRLDSFTLKCDGHGWRGNFPKLAHYIDLNWHGRYLLDNRNQQVPLSLWPLALEKVKKDPNVMYEFLKGPGFAARF